MRTSAQHADHVVYIPKVRDALSAITASVPLQLFARAIAVGTGVRRRTSRATWRKA